MGSGRVRCTIRTMFLVVATALTLTPAFMTPMTPMGQIKSFNMNGGKDCTFGEATRDHGESISSSTAMSKLAASVAPQKVIVDCGSGGTCGPTDVVPNINPGAIFFILDI